MLSQFNIDQRTNYYKHILLTFLVILISVTVTIISSNRSLAAYNALLGLSLLGGVYCFNIFLYLPLLIVIRFVRGERAFGFLVLKCLSIVLWSFIPLASLWIGASIVSLTFYDLPWSVFSNIFFWGKAIIVPFSLFYFYNKFNKENIFDSLFDSMLAAGLVLILSLIKW